MLGVWTQEFHLSHVSCRFTFARPAYLDSISELLDSCLSSSTIYRNWRNGKMFSHVHWEWERKYCWSQFSFSQWANWGKWWSSNGSPSRFLLSSKDQFSPEIALKRPPSLDENPIWIGLAPSLPDRWCMDYPWKWVIYGWMPSCRESRWIAWLLMTSNGEMFEFQIREETRVFSHTYSFHLM